MLEIFTRHYYPSPQLIYSFLHFLKSVQSSSSESLALAFLNALKFAQAMEGFKGVAVSVLENELRLKEKECSLQLEPRETMFSETELHDQLKIEVRLLNNRRYRFKVCNDIISTYKRRLLHILKLLDL